MARDKGKDDKFFNCEQDHELKYVSGLYADSEIIHAFLKDNCGQSIKYLTHKQLYELIRERLGYPIPF